jgi:hypothetical protein
LLDQKGQVGLRCLELDIDHIACGGAIERQQYVAGPDSGAGSDTAGRDVYDLSGVIGCHKIHYRGNAILSKCTFAFIV